LSDINEHQAGTVVATDRLKNLLDLLKLYRDARPCRRENLSESPEEELARVNPYYAPGNTVVYAGE
jgi:hypothetical protein